MTDDKITTETLSISLPSQVIGDMDAKRKAEYKNRSEYIKDLILADLNQPKFL
jgi:Arc/MetJ-type ribon-helix-helix transcriptional regulator